MSLVQMSGKSFTYIINKSGRSTLPCGKCHFVCHSFPLLSLLFRITIHKLLKRSISSFRNLVS